MLDKTKQILKRQSYRLRQDYLTLNNLVIGAALIIALSWSWSSIESMQQNYDLQQQIDNKKQQLEIEKLRVETLELESKYYSSIEYQELAVRERLGKGMPGEKMLIVESTDVPGATKSSKRKEAPPTSNLQEWMNYLFGQSRKNLK